MAVIVAVWDSRLLSRCSPACGWPPPQDRFAGGSISVCAFFDIYAKLVRLSHRNRLTLPPPVNWRCRAKACGTCSISACENTFRRARNKSVNQSRDRGLLGARSIANPDNEASSHANIKSIQPPRGLESEKRSTAEYHARTDASRCIITHLFAHYSGEIEISAK